MLSPTFFVYSPIYLTSLTLMFKLLLDIILATGPPRGHEHDPILSPIFSPSNGTLHQILGPKQNRKPNGMDGELSYTAPHISTMFPVYSHFSTLFPWFFSEHLQPPCRRQAFPWLNLGASTSTNGVELIFRGISPWDFNPHKISK